MIEITFLGTSHAVPTKEKNQTAILLSHGAEKILVDCGEGTQRQFKIAGLNLCKITKILITHWHGDHILGLPGLLQTLAMGNYSKILKIYGPRGTKEFMKLMLSIFVFREKIKVEVHEISEGTFFEDNDFKLEAYKMQHQSPCLAYAFIEKEKYNLDIEKLKKQGIEPGPWLKELKEKGKIKIKDKVVYVKDYAKVVPEKKISFILDTSYNKNCVKAAKNSELLIGEACFLNKESKLAEERGHLTAEQLGLIAKKAQVKKLFLTHISQRYSAKEKQVLSESKKIFKNSELARDFMKIEV
jgi:ribonuclease Z